MSLYVGNLHPECDDAILYNKFSVVGEVSSVKVCRDSETAKSLGYGYVNYANFEDARKVMETMNYDMLYGRVMRIMWARSNPKSELPQSANLVVKNLDGNVDELSLKKVFDPFGEVRSVKVVRNEKGDSKGYGFVQFGDEKDAECAVASMHENELCGRKIQISRYIPAEERRRFQESIFPNNIYVGNLSSSVREEELFQLCDAFGEVLSCKVVEGPDSRSKGYGFVNFRERSSAEKAVQELNRLCLDGKKVYASVVVRKK